MIQNTETAAQVQQLQHAATFIREGFVTLNPAQANAVLRECPYDRQRNIDKLHVAVLAELMRRGLWEPKDKLDFARLGSRLILVNGYHRMSAQVAAGKNIQWTIVIHDCGDEASVRQLYYKFDTNVRKRTATNIVQGADIAQEYGLSKTMAQALFAAVPTIASGLVTGNRFSATQTATLFAQRIADDRFDLVREYADSARAFEATIKPAPAKVRSKLLRSGVLALALVTVKEQMPVAEEFWGGLAMNDGLRRYDPRATLLNDLLDRNFGKGSMQQVISVPATAWNAFWERRDLKVINKVAHGRSFRLLGTPYTVRT